MRVLALANVAFTPRGYICGAVGMSALGQKQTYALQKAMSALPPIATLIAFFGMSALGQKRTSQRLFDHLVCSYMQGLWDCKPECFGGFEV